MQIIEVQRGSIEARNSSNIKLQRGELFVNNINFSPELLVGIGNGKYERMGGMGTLSFAGTKAPASMIKLLNGETKPTQGGIYVLRGGNLDLSEISAKFYEPNESITLFNGYSLTDKLYDGDILAYVKNGTSGNQGEYGWVKLLSERALKLALDTKADLDPSTGKVLLSQLPDTVTGGLDYQGLWNKKSLPTKNAGRDNDTSLNKDIETHENLVKGDYWIYTGEDWDISGVSEIISKGSKENNEAFYLKLGDNLVYNGDGTWGVIDNTDAFIGLKIQSIVNGESAVLDGIVVIFDKERETGLMETQVSINENGIKIESPNAALIPTPETAEPGTLYKEKNGNKVLTPSGISETEAVATIDESNAQLNLKSSKFGHTTEIRTNKDSNFETVQLLPKTSGILINTNSIIDCGEWTTNANGTISFSCEEGEVSEAYIPTNSAYQVQGTLDSTLLPPAKKYYDEFMVSTDINIIVGKYEITRSLYKEIMGEDPSADYPMTADEGDERPVDSVTISQARDFCNKLSLKDGLTPVYDDDGNIIDEATGYRLPTAGEFVNFGQAGQETIFSGTNGSLKDNGNDASYSVFVGDPIGYETRDNGVKVPVYDSSVETRPVQQSDLQSWVNPFSSSRANLADEKLCDYAWVKWNVDGVVENVPQPLSAVANADWSLFIYNGKVYKSNAYGWAAKRGNINDGQYGTHAVGTKLPNAFGIYDVTGNVAELCEDGVAYGGDIAANTSRIAFNVGNVEYKVVGFRIVLNKTAVNFQD